MSDNPIHAGPPVRSLVAQIVSEYVKKNQVSPADMPTLISTVHQSLMSLGKAPEPPPKDPAVPIRQSVRPTYVVCLECGLRGNMLRRHLQAHDGLTAEQYRAKWKLSPDHALTAPAYSQRRSALAKRLGWGEDPNNGRGGGERPEPRLDPGSIKTCIPPITATYFFGGLGGFGPISITMITINAITITVGISHKRLRRYIAHTDAVPIQTASATGYLNRPSNSGGGR